MVQSLKIVNIVVESPVQFFNLLFSFRIELESPVYDDVVSGSIYQNVQRTHTNNTGITNVTIFKYSLYKFIENVMTSI